MRFKTCCIILIQCALASSWSASLAAESEERIVLREDFNDLAGWQHFQFPSISKYSTFTITRKDDDAFLKMESADSASGIIFQRPFKVYEDSKLTWRWKVENVIAGGDARTRSGDDFSARLYVLFEMDLKNAGFFKRRRAEIARRYYGGFSVDTALCYIWANRAHKERFMPNPYAKEVMMVPMQAGSAKVGKWVVQKVEIASDYRQAFDKPAPAIATLALMCDTDQTGERSTAYIDFIELLR